MSDPELVRVVVREWIGKAENDLLTAVHTLKLGRACPTDTISFHARQCVEKYFKAHLVWQGLDFPKTHDLARLASRLPGSLRQVLSRDELARLTEYATVGRYPGAEAISIAEARRAVAAARRARLAIRRAIPRAVLWRRPAE